MSEGRRRPPSRGGGGGENGGTEFVSVSGAAAGGGAARRSRCLSDVLSLGSHATATGVPGSRDRARAAFTTRARSSRSRVSRGKRSSRPTSSGAQGSRRSGGGRGTASGTSSVATAARRAEARRCWRWRYEVGIVQRQGTNVYLSTRQPSSGLCRPQTTSASNDLFDYVHKCGTCGSRFVHRALPLDYADLIPAPATTCLGSPRRYCDRRRARRRPAAERKRPVLSHPSFG